MKRIPRLLLSVAASAALAGGTLAVTGSPGTAAADAQTTASSHLAADASGELTYRSAGGVYDFVGVPAGVTVDDPGVSSSTSVTDAAAAHLARYGAAFGSTQAGSTFTRTASTETATGDVVRYQQRVGGVPVLGGDLVITMRSDRELSSILARTSPATKVAEATVTEPAATAEATAAFVKAAGKGGAPTVRSDGRWVLDAGLVGGDAALSARTVWRFEVTRGAAERRMILVDDRTGGVLMNADLIQHALNRVVCDNNNVLRDPNAADPRPCVTATPPTRVEGGPATGIADVDVAYDLAGAVSATYTALGVDLTTLIGRDIGGGTKALAQTVRLCFTGFTCPYGNAFWNGIQMYYGQGFASADDVVGHEMTHGVTERNSNLMYWGQSGAMNESISDIMGEIVDHQNVTPADVPATEWAIGEDVPGFPTGLRNIQDPTLKGDPDRTGSALYVQEGLGYPDNDGVHSNSGVGNKTFYLASQGGTFNGETIAGIDAGDPTLTKSAKLWLLVDQTLASGSDYADLGVVLDQSCQALLTAGTHGFTAANCTAVHQAGLATELAETPVNNPQPADAPATCSGGATKVELFNSETGTPATKFVANPIWSRNGVPGYGQIAHTAPDAWGGDNITTAGANALVAATGIALPAGQASYLHFQQWRLLEYGSSAANNYDAGTVEVDNTGDASPPVDAAPLPWINGPEHTIPAGFGNPAAGRVGFGRDSRGYIASRLDLSSFAGTTIKPQFTLNSDSSSSELGWWLDDIQVYTCVAGPPITNNTLPSITGTPKMGQTLTADPGTWSETGASYAYQWLRGASDIPGATSSTYQPVAADVGSPLAVRVTASKSGFSDGVATSLPTAAVQGVMTPGTPTIVGTAVVGSTLTALPGTWVPADAAFAYAWKAGGTAIPGATSSTYQATASDVGKQLTVTVTGTKANWDPGTATSGPTAAVAPGAQPVVVAGSPTIKGKAVVGKKLTAVPGTWGPAPVTLTYQWLRNGVPIKGATGSKYKLKGKDKGKRISVQVTGAKAGYTSTSATSPKTKKVKKKKKKPNHRVVAMAGRLE